MKHCKKCHTNYAQEGVNFCRYDGDQLCEAAFDSSETLRMSKNETSKYNENMECSIWFRLLQYDLDLYEKGLSSPVTIAAEYAQLGNKEKALEWLEEAYSHHSKELPYIGSNPSLSKLSSDSRYKDLLKRIESAKH